MHWHTLLDRPAVSAAQFRYEQVPFDHPLWTLFSSGTTGLPKPIVHGHGGILLEILKNGTFHFDLHPGERVFYFTTTGWMLWNFLTGTPLTGAVPVLYDGHPAYPTPDVLWKMADEAGVVTFGASPTYVDQLSRSGIVPRERYKLGALRTVNLAGSPATPESMAWFYRNVKQDLWVANGSGGTDCCTGFVGGVPTLAVRAGEIQAPSLGVSVKAYNAKGESVIDEVGELVLTEPMPSMPLRFWNDPGDRRYLETYFQEYPGHLAPRGLLPHQRAGRLLRAGALGRHPQPLRRTHRHGRDLPHARPAPGSAGCADREPRPAGRRASSCRCS